MYPSARSCTGGKYEDFAAAAKLLHKSGDKVKVPTFLVPATQKVWVDVYGLPVAGCSGKTAAQIFEEAGCVPPAAPSCAACLGGPRDTFARLNEAETVVSTTNRCAARSCFEGCCTGKVCMAALLMDRCNLAASLPHLGKQHDAL